MIFGKKNIIPHMGYCTDVGRVRDHNEDNFHWHEPDLRDNTLLNKGWLYVLADGMGGHESGEIASKIAVEVIVQQFIASKQTVNLALKESILAANTAIFNRNHLGSESGMGTTIVCAAILLDKLYIAHVGDSRAYLLRKGKLSRLTKDHTLVNELLNNNVITSEEAQNHPQSNVLIRALGKKASVLPEISGPLLLQNNDLLLLCTDGISGYMDDEQISFLLQTNSNDPQIAATALIQNADSIGGEDNATAIVILMGNT